MQKSSLIPAGNLRVGGVFNGQIVRDGEVIDEFDCPNLVVNEGLDSLLDVYLGGDTAVPAWYLGLFQGNYTPVATITAAAIAATATENVDYNEANRPTFTPASADTQSITNVASRATFTFNAPRTIYGAFLISSNTKNGTAGTLFSAARFGTAKNVVVADQLLLTYSFSASSA
jgi:hypothetical protein